jgi:hypothetical protein
LAGEPAPYCGLSTDADGAPIAVSARLDEIAARYGADAGRTRKKEVAADRAFAQISMP